MRRRRSLRTVSETIRKKPTLAEIMRIGLLVHKDGGIWVFHDKPFPDPLDYAEYDADEKTMSFIGKSGLTMDLGLPIKPSLGEELKNCDCLMAALVQDEDVKDMTMVTFHTRSIKDDDDTRIIRKK